jgi:hypothetical protein
VIVAMTLAIGMCAALPGPAVADPSASFQSSATPGASDGTQSSLSCTPTVFTQKQHLLGSELAQRVGQLDSLLVRVNGAANLTSSDKTSLLADLAQTELPGIQALQTKVPGDSTCAQLRNQTHAMVLDYRVYRVMTPQTDLVIANDATVHAAGVLANLATVASGQIQNSRAHGTDVSGAQAFLADFQANVTASQNLISGQSATLLAQTPQGYPGNALAFLQARTNLTNARNDLRAARHDLAQITHDLLRLSEAAR